MLERVKLALRVITGTVSIHRVDVYAVYIVGEDAAANHTFIYDMGIESPIRTVHVTPT